MKKKNQHQEKANAKPVAGSVTATYGKIDLSLEVFKIGQVRFLSRWFTTLEVHRISENLFEVFDYHCFHESALADLETMHQVNDESIMISQLDWQLYEEKNLS